MLHLIDKDALVAEIEKQRALVEKRLLKNNSYSHSGKIAWERDKALYDRCEFLLSFLNTLEVKEVDLEKAIDDYIYTHDGRTRLALEPDWKYCNLTLKGGNEIIKFAKHFFELGLKAQKGE